MEAILLLSTSDVSPEGVVSLRGAHQLEGILTVLQMETHRLNINCRFGRGRIFYAPSSAAQNTAEALLRHLPGGSLLIGSAAEPLECLLLPPQARQVHPNVQRQMNEFVSLLFEQQLDLVVLVAEPLVIDLLSKYLLETAAQDLPRTTQLPLGIPSGQALLFSWTSEHASRPPVLIVPPPPPRNILYAEGSKTANAPSPT